MTLALHTWRVSPPPWRKPDEGEVLGLLFALLVLLALRDLLFSGTLQ